jgi:hypothetical protein
VIGKATDLGKCNYFISKCRMPTFNHFYESTATGDERWNPGQSFSRDLLSVRGFYINVR